MFVFGRALRRRLREQGLRKEGLRQGLREQGLRKEGLREGAPAQTEKTGAVRGDGASGTECHRQWYA